MVESSRSYRTRDDVITLVVSRIWMCFWCLKNFLFEFLIWPIQIAVKDKSRTLRSSTISKSGKGFWGQEVWELSATHLNISAWGNVQGCPRCLVTLNLWLTGICHILRYVLCFWTCVLYVHKHTVVPNRTVHSRRQGRPPGPPYTRSPSWNHST